MKKGQKRKPDWLKVKVPGGAGYKRIDRYHREQGLNTVCRSAACPNQGECWGNGTATFMILGDRCSRNCGFCNVAHNDLLPPDPDEAKKVASAIAELKLQHAVVTSVTRDDLDDGGARQFCDLVSAIHDMAPDCKIELLIPDLQGNRAALAEILAAGPDILGHNLETVPRLYEKARQGADYNRSLYLLRNAGEIAPHIPTKSGLMLGMGETLPEVEQTLHDLHTTGCSMLTLGQYLAPTRNHLPVARYVTPQEFLELKRLADKLGFAHVEAGPLVRSSYHAEKQLQEAAHGDNN
ncbi:MAG: lipoyl synthase [Desulfuromonas sp.]|nr:MAG: lipoyl synthase [Desulfuromonas sp.]